MRVMARIGLGLGDKTVIAFWPELRLVQNCAVDSRYGGTVFEPQSLLFLFFPAYALKYYANGLSLTPCEIKSFTGI